MGCSLLLHNGPLHAQKDRRIAYSFELSGTVDPATERWVAQALEEAEGAGAPLAIARLDTPGGLDSSMRSMVKDIVAAPMPVVVYVSPNGARAASAGLFVTQAADVAAMAPQTNIGSATPVQIGPGEEDEVLGRKVRNDAAAYVRALDDALYTLVEDRDAIARSVRSLADIEREVLRLRFTQDLSQREIGERIGCSQMQVSRLLRRALADLKAAATSG